MKKQKGIMILLLLLPLLFVLYLFGPFILMPFIDSSWYYSEDVDIGSFDYSSVLTKAENVGYEVEGSWPWPGNFSGFEPGDVPEVRESFGSAALVENIRLNSENSELMIFVCENGPEAGGQTCVAVSNLSHADPEAPLQLSEFPEDSWMLEKFGLLFDPDENDSEKYLEALKKAAQNQTWDAEIQVNESPNFPAVYAYLLENSNESGYGSGLGLNAYPTEVFLKEGRQLGSVKYSIPEAKVTTYDNGNRYTVELDSSGKVQLEIVMPVGSSGESIPEEEYRTVFREMFEEMGLSSEAVDRFEFFHSSSRIW
ncbi:hypothetical protein MSSAC_1676 [Methanosarcina siciliae C2J]|uniref:Uncharacterized protein n=1 Tax=Methanosarcina siciliae C2J TaxID=1434118 RepID=A0A0E3LCX2_9EURY|nr:hypothetical protein [Methanosarcina siciliae]AKB36266.1 hypothetical protein MSSAC_1676 [Methanosarcina siciliae C2J]